VRIAYFTESCLPLVDGVSLTLAHLFGALERAGHEFRVYSPFVPDTGVSWHGRVRRVRSMAFPAYPDYRVSLPGGRAVGRDLDAFEPDIIHVVSPTPMALWAQAQARRRGLPVVATFHTHFVAYARHYGVSWLEPAFWLLLRRFHARCTATYAPSRSMVAELQARGVPRVRLWSRGVDAERFQPGRRDAALRASLGADEATPLLLLVSRLVREKDLAELVEMDERLRARGLSYRFALVGDGPMRAELEAALPHAHFPGHQGGAELARWYASADVFVFPSTTETFGNVVLEALASGLPAVVVDRGGPQDVVAQGRTGFIVDAGDAAALADAVGTLLADAPRRRTMSAAARASARGWEWDAVTAQLIREYESLRGAAVGARAAP
jgi:phosphatidylinositol alpha 1,6-mannosyltransferase